jgi:hypothetical protein
MKADDPELEKAQKKMFERAEKMDKLTLAVLRSHVVAEQCVTDYILAGGAKRKWFSKKIFWDKMQKCKLLAKEEGKDPLWGVLEAANELRNKIGHTLAADEIADKMVQLKKKYLVSLPAKRAADLKDQPDDYIALSACSTCAGFIATLRSRVRSAQV